VSGQPLFVPGRLCLFGEHSDWAGRHRALSLEIQPGHCIAVGTSQGIYTRVSRNGERMLVDSHGVNGAVESFSCVALPGELRQAAKSGGFYSYCAGVAAYMCERFRVGGISIQTTSMDLPLKKGLSSSAAVCVLTARAYNRIYDLNLSVRDEMECAYQGEIQTGSECGRMDQVCAFGQTPVFLTFDGDGMDVQMLRPRVPLHLVVVDLQKGKDTRRILHDLNAALGADSAIGANVRDALGSKNAQILRRARAALEHGDAQTVGHLMHEAQSIFDCQVAPACPGELQAPKLHEVLQHPLVRELAWGGKGVGSQGDGCAQLTARDLSAQQRLIQELPKLLGVHCLALNIAANGEEPHEP
jgi:mevalonate kinase